MTLNRIFRNPIWSLAVLVALTTLSWPQVAVGAISEPGIGEPMAPDHNLVPDQVSTEELELPVTDIAFFNLDGDGFGQGHVWGLRAPTSDSWTVAASMEYVCQEASSWSYNDLHRPGVVLEFWNPPRHQRNMKHGAFCDDRQSNVPLCNGHPSNEVAIRFFQVEES